jgi:hypothetical protein
MRKFTGYALALSLTLVVFNCKHEMHGKCFEEKNINACGEICQMRDDAQACAQQTELGIKQCIEGGNLKTWSYMCLFAKDGKDLYCKKQKELCNEAKNKQNDNCALVN